MPASIKTYFLVAAACVLLITAVVDLELRVRVSPRYKAKGPESWILHRREHRIENELTSTTDSSRVQIHEESSEPDLVESILQDMHRCSVNMGVSTDTLKRKHRHMNMIANKAAIFLDTFWEVVPKKYLEGVRNPCWHSNITFDAKKVQDALRANLGPYLNKLDSSNVGMFHNLIFKNLSTPRLLCLPSFLIAGFPKSGTTSLHFILSKHPQVSPLTVKGPQWWARIPLEDLNHKYLKVVTARYLLEFLPVAEQISKNREMITYDASQTTLIDSNYNVDGQDYCTMASVVHRVLPNAKMLVIMREPVSRMYSHYYYIHTAQGWPKEMKDNPALYFHKYVKVAINEFQQCRKEHSLFECANRKTNREQLGTWLGVGIYHVHLLKWLQFWPRENFLFMEMSQLDTEPDGLFRTLPTFSL